MASSRKSAILVLSAALGVAQATAQQPEGKKPAAIKAGKEGKTAKPSAKAEEALDLPVPKGQPQKGVKVPLYDTKGRLTMNFEIGIGTWIDDDNVKLEKLRVETFKEDGSRELDMDLPDAVYNRKKKVISSNTAVTVKRNDFEITGKNMAFNVETREGILGGGVKMIIYNHSDDDAPKEDKPTVEFKSQPAPQPNPPPKKEQK